MTPDLPAALKVALDRKAEGLSRNDAARRSAAISEAYRSGGTSRDIRTTDDALAYAMARMPATYAAVAASLNALIKQQPDFAPKTLLDVGAGPGTAIWAALQAYATLTDIVALDANAALRTLALDLLNDGSRRSDFDYRLSDVAAVRDTAPADLVIASYVINELCDSARSTLIDAMWEKTIGVLLVIEPGTPAGYERILDVRNRLIGKGGHITAPCPHDLTCPLIAPDWCHFSQRLPRSRAHKQLKGAELPFEDEKFIYVAMTRTQPTRAHARVLTQPIISKPSITAKLCTGHGLQIATIPRRDKTAFAAARRWDWGDAVPQIKE